MSEESLFLAALEKNVPVEREAFLNEACGTDRALRARVQLLLDADARARGILDQPAAVELVVTGAYAAGEKVGSVIAGRYKLLEAIGEGGMGTVWAAEQTEPVRRKVALKLIKAGMDSRSVLARFEAERQALAVMDHPNIAKVLDGGLTETGRPFFVMEYVKGVPITEYCDTARLSIAQRLNLFMLVCQAVQHAHHKGIIHRDLKPSNILVAPYDDRPVPKVIDFGLAKAMHQSLTERTLHTAHEMVLGTPLYMSPEQAQLNNLDVDTRSDIYSLGVLLYELLTGTTPLEKLRFKQAAWDEVKRIIREEDPPRPSLRLSSAQTLPSLAAGRQIDPLRLTKLVRGELDWIVMKSLEKDRNRRYESANGFAMDIQRYLSGEPVSAAPPSTRYRLQKFVRKNRASLTTAASIATLLVAGAAFSSWQAVRATRAEAVARQAAEKAIAAQRAEAERAEGERLAKLDAEAKQAEAERQQARAEAGEKLASQRLSQVDAARQNAEQEKQISSAVLNFLQIKLLSQADVTMQADSLLLSGGVEALTEIETNPTIRELLDRAARELAPDRIEQSFPNQPRVQAAILQTVGRSYSAIGVRKQAIEFLERSVALHRKSRGQHDAYTLDSMTYLAAAYRTDGRLDKAVSLFQEILDVRSAAHGPDHAATIASLINLSQTYLYAGKVRRALPLFEQTLERSKATLGPGHRTTLSAMYGLACALSYTGQHDRALQLWQELLRGSSATRGPAHPRTLNIRHGLGNAYKRAGKADLALPLYEETLKLSQATFGPDHPSTLLIRANLSAAYQLANLPDRAATLDEETLLLSKIKLDADDPDTLQSLNNIADAYLMAGKADQAAPLYEKVLNFVRAKHGPDHPTTLDTMNRLASFYTMARKCDLAAPLLQTVREILTAKHGPDHPETMRATAALASCYKFSGKLDLAIPLREDTLRRRTAQLGRDHPETLTSIHELGVAYLRSGKTEQALELYDELVRLRISRFGLQHLETANAITSAEQVFHEVRNYQRGAAMYEQVWTLRKKELPEGDKFLIDAQNRIGLNLLLGGHLSEAEPHLLTSYEDAAKAPALPEEWRLDYVIRLVGLYAEWDKPDEVAKWQGELRNFGDEAETRLSGAGSQMLKALRYRGAERLLRDCLTIREKLRPDDWQTFETKSLIGGALLGQNNATDAEPLLLAGYEGMKQRSAEILPGKRIQLTDAVARLVRLYETIGDKNKAEKWRNELKSRRPSNE